MVHTISMRPSRLAQAFVTALLVTSAVQASETLHVPSLAYPTIQSAVSAAQTGDTILVAAGRYTGVGNRDINLGIKDLIIRSADGPATCVIDCEGTPGAAQRGFLLDHSQSSATIIEGFTITGGTTDQGAVADDFNGAAIRILGGSPVLRNCIFDGNTASCWGGAVFIAQGGSPLIENCIFKDNFSGDGGGGIFSWNLASPTVRNCVFIRNDGVNRAGAILHWGGVSNRMIIQGCTIVENMGVWGSALELFYGDIRNSIIWGNVGLSQVIGNSTVTTASHCNFEGGVPDTVNDLGGSISADPLFKSDGHHLRAFSPCLDAGDPMTTVGMQRDIDGQRRRWFGIVDMGADEIVPMPVDWR